MLLRIHFVAWAYGGLAMNLSDNMVYHFEGIGIGELEFPVLVL